MNDGAEKVKLLLTGVLYVPKIGNKLLSLPAMTGKDTCVQFKGKLCELIVKGKHFRIGQKHGKLLKLNTEPTHKSYIGSRLLNAFTKGIQKLTLIFSCTG